MSVYNVSVEYKKLPLISVLSSAELKQAKELLEELDSIRETMDLAESREKEVKELLEQIQTTAKLPGLRFGTLCFVAKTLAGKVSLSRERLLENGVTADVIKDSMVQGQPYVTRTFHRLPG